MLQTCMLLPKINLMKNWVSAKDQGLLVGISMGGMSVANAVSNPIGAAICNYGGWRSIFYLPGNTNSLLLVCVLWLLDIEFLGELQEPVVYCGPFSDCFLFMTIQTNIHV